VITSSSCASAPGRGSTPPDPRIGCLTWSKPREISVHGILPTVLTLPDGTLALASGRPDNTLSFSFDDGESWPWTYRILDQTNPLHP